MSLSEAQSWWAGVMEATSARETRPLPERADVAILGAGHTGLSAARTLAKAGASVVVLEKQTLGWGASARNGGQVLTGMKLGPAARQTDLVQDLVYAWVGGSDG